MMYLYQANEKVKGWLHLKRVNNNNIRISELAIVYDFIKYKAFA